MQSCNSRASKLRNPSLRSATSYSLPGDQLRLFKVQDGRQTEKYHLIQGPFTAIIPIFMTKTLKLTSGSRLMNSEKRENITRLMCLEQLRQCPTGTQLTIHKLTDPQGPPVGEHFNIYDDVDMLYCKMLMKTRLLGSPP